MSLIYPLLYCLCIKMESILSDESKFMAESDSDDLYKLERKINSNLMNVNNEEEFYLLKFMGLMYPDLYEQQQNS
ncbi:unnamed protein product [Schistosoma curassoni]|uniref:Uncharacterized protein n=1 Tax=Schistosoma curassoni TaxID=6186 RepID=A0A183JWR1_9TREM|nr:unnamed protein product [Schistosoma curassoni]